MVGLKSLPAHMRPRERLLREGAEALEDAELLALILGTGRGTGEDALSLAHRVLATVGGWSGLRQMDVRGLMSISGIGPVKGARLNALFEIGRRDVKVSAPPATPPQPEPAPDPMEVCIRRLRGQVPTGESAILGYSPEEGRAPVTLALGEGLSPNTRPGALLARLLQVPPSERWWVVCIRPSGKPREPEREVARRLVSGGALVGLPLEQVVLISGRGHWVLG